jgi:hypothetical protein
LEKIRVPEVWNNFGIQGANVTVGVIDTGIAADHPDLLGKLRPVNGWFDPYGDTPSPSDWHGHGTHVSGTIAGGNASGTYIGVAPQATLIVAQLFNEDGQATDAAVLACMQWMMDPDDDPNTNDGADVVNNSWGYLYSHAPNMYDPIKDALNAWIAANIVPVFSIGNEGPSPRTTRSPGDYPMALGVGATDSNDNIAYFSSRGPVFWEGIGEIIKPDVSAPGVYVYSSVPGGGYEYWHGTSMASPHVAGTVALMISYARSQGGSLSVDTIKQLLKTTAVDLGQSGPDNDYGWGRIDAFAALVLLASDANEPNNNPSQATFIAFGETKFGRIEPDTDEDFFKFTGTQNTVITVKIDAQSLGSGIDAVLQILDSDGTTVLAESDDSNGSKDPYIAKFVLPHAGDFYIRITSKDFSNELRHYTLTLKLRSVPNLIATYNPQDNSVTLQWGSVFNSHRLASKRPMIRPLDLQGYRVYRATQAQGPYYLIASLPPDQTTYTDTNLPGQLVLYYRVTALYDEGESDPATARILADPTEPNDDPTTATQIAYGQSLQGIIAVSGDVDFYKFDGQEGDLVTVEVRAEVGSPLNSVLTLYDSDGQTVLAFNDDFADWWWVTYDSKLVRFPLPHDGTFYLKVEDYSGSGSENHFYTLTLVRDTPDDHGDWPQNATPINAGENLPGVINPPPDTDYFVFNANAGDLIIAEIFARRQGSPLDPMLALYDEQGNLLAFNDDYYGLDSAIFYRIPQTGRYFLRVMPYGGPYIGGPNYTYTLSLTLLLPPRISVTPISIEETLLQGNRGVVSVNVANVGGESLTFFTRSATSAISTLSVQQPARRRIMFVPETSKLYQDYLRLRQQKQRELQQVILKLLAKRDPNSQRLTQALQDSVVSPELIPLKGGKPISTLQNEQPPSGTWRWIIVDPDEYGEQQGNAINVTKVFYQSDGTYLYFRAELDGGDFDPQNAYFNIFLDTDRNAGTGGRWIVDGMGIDYILYGGLGQVGVFKFNPVTGNFEQVADFIWFKPVNGAVEVGVKLSDIGNPMDLHVACEFYDSNTGRLDRIPDIWYAPITREVPWLDRSPVAGSLLANESVNVELTLDSTSLGLGIHRANLVFNSNDLEKQQLTVPITLTVMQIPNIPDLISPADGAIVRPQVTFVLKSTDPDGDRVKFVIEARKGNEVKTYETEFVASGQEASLTVPEGLSSGEWTWKAKAIDERGQESSFSNEQTFIVNQLPTKPELIAPNNNAIVSPTPTFKVKGTDPDGDALKFKLVIKQGEQIVAVFDQTQQTIGWDKESYQSGEEATFTVPTNQRLTAGNYLWVAFAFDGKEWSEASEGRVIIVNQVVSVPELLSPISGAIVRPTVTFKLKSTDPDGDRVKFVIEARKGNEVKTYETGFVASGQEASLTVPEGLSSGEWKWKAKAIDERGQESSFSSEQTFIVNQLPTKPELIAPNNNAIVSATPTFKLKSFDADGDQVKFEIEVAKGSRVEVLVTNFVNSGTEVSLIVPEDQSLSPGQWTWRARAIDAKGEAGEWSDSRTIQVISVPLIRSGLRLVACPVIGPADPKPVFAFDGNKWAWFDPTTSGYLLYPDSQTNLQVGKGYWAKFVQDTKPNVEGNLPDTNQPFFVALKKGWNLIGNPWLVDLVWDLSSIKVKVGGQEKALKDLGESEGVEPYAWRWDGSSYRLVYDTNVGIIGIDSALPSWEGVWVYAHTDCELILPPPSQSKGRGTRGEGRVAKGNGWSMRLQASVDGSIGEAVMGIANGTRGLAVGLPPEPPTGNNGVQVILLKNNTPLAVDVRSDGARRQEWEVLVRFGTRDGGRGTSERKEVVLTFDGIGYAPKDVSAWLVDTVTGKRIYLRTQPSYRFAPEVGETERRFKVIVESGNERPLRIVGLKATPMRGEGLVITFALTKPAQVRGEVMTLTGRKIAVMDEGSTRMAGTHRMIWRGVGSEGVKVPIGAYLVRLVATDEDGRQVQAVTVVRSR